MVTEQGIECDDHGNVVAWNPGAGFDRFEANRGPRGEVVNAPRVGAVGGRVALDFVHRIAPVPLADQGRLFAALAEWGTRQRSLVAGPAEFWIDAERDVLVAYGGPGAPIGGVAHYWPVGSMEAFRRAEEVVRGD